MVRRRPRCTCCVFYLKVELETVRGSELLGDLAGFSGARPVQRFSPGVSAHLQGRQGLEHCLDVRLIAATTSAVKCASARSEKKLNK